MMLTRFIVNAYITRKEPLSIVHFLTDRCNARCPHCFMDFGNPVPGEDLLSLDEITRMTKTMGRGLYNVNLTGGEPFLRRDLFDIVTAYFGNTTAENMVITTNGTLVDEVRDFVEKYREARFPGRVKISVSIDHPGERHDRARNVPGAFRKAMESYSIVDNSGDGRLMADVALTVTPWNHTEINGTFATLREMGVRNFSAVLMREEGVVAAMEKREEVLSAYRTLVSRIRADRSRNAPARHRFQEAVRIGKNAIVADLVAGNGSGPPPVRCMAGNLFGVISADGDVWPCEILGRDSCIGNLRDAGFDFMALWQGERYSSLSRQRERECRRCTYECAWSVNVLASPMLLARSLALSCKDMLWT